MTYDRCVKALYNIPMFGKKSALERMGFLLEQIGNPQDNLDFIHVAGTNGKGSVCKMISTIYTEADYSVGMFTSPHIHEVNERIQLNNQPISNDDLVNTYKLVQETIDGLALDEHPTFFEMIFMMSLLYFSKKDVEIVVLETGIGGLLDCTNIIKAPLLSVITRIDKDHTNLLGDDYKSIAKHKAGIIKEGSKVVTVDQKEAVLEVLSEACHLNKTNLEIVGENMTSILNKTGKGIDFSYDSKYYKYIGLHINTVASYQVENTALAITGVLMLQDKFPLTESFVRSGVEAFYWPGRLEVIAPSVLVDGAHNVHGISMFVKEIKRLFPDEHKFVVLGIKSSKDYKGMIEAVLQMEGLSQLRLLPMDEYLYIEEPYIIKLTESNKHIKLVNTLGLAIRERYSQHNDGVLCCIGSLYMIHDIKEIIGGYEK